MCLAQGPQRSGAGEARTCGPSVSSQALYHLATALPGWLLYFNCFVAVCGLFFVLMVPWIGLQSVTMAFPGHIYFQSDMQERGFRKIPCVT